MSLADLGRNDVSEETQALKDKLASRDTECAGLRTQLMRRDAELEELQATFNETVYKLSKEAEQALRLEEEVSARSSELRTERMSLRNTELALQSAQDRLKAEEHAKRELESTLDTVSLHSQATNAEHQSVQRDKRALEIRVRELERIVQTHESRRVSNIPHKSGRPRSSSVSNFRLPAVEQELNDAKAQIHSKEKSLRVLEQKLAQAQDDLVKAENARISIDKAGQKRVSELLSTLEQKEEELESLRQADGAGEREEELLKRIDEDAAKIAALEKLVTEGQVARTSQARIQKLQNQLKAEFEKVHRSEDLRNRLLHEKEELIRQYEVSQRKIHDDHELLMARESHIRELEARHAHLRAELDTYSRCKEPVSLDAEHAPSHRQDGGPTFSSESALADHIQILLQAIDRLRDERDGLKRALEFSEVEYRITTDGFEARVASLSKQLVESSRAIVTDNSPTSACAVQKVKHLTSCAAVFSVVISNLQTHLDLSEDRLSVAISDLTSSNSRLHDALAVIDNQERSSATNAHERDALLLKLDATSNELSESNAERDRMRLQLADVEGQVAVMVEVAKTLEAAKEEAYQSFLLAEQRFSTLNKNYQDIESERNSLALQATNLQDDLACLQGELADAQKNYNVLHTQQLSAMSATQVVQAFKDRIQELEAGIVRHTDQINDYQHDIRRLETNADLHEERIAEMTLELELLISQKEAMVEDCAEAREARDEAIGRCEAAQDEVESLQQQMQQARHVHNAELSAMSLVVEKLTSENQQTTARIADLEAENAGFIRELDALVSRSRSLELEISMENADTQQAVVSLAIIYRGYKDSTRQLQKSYRHIATLESQLIALSQVLEQKSTLVGSIEEEKHELRQRLSYIGGEANRSQDDHDVDFVRNVLREKEQELAATRQLLEETKCQYSGVEAGLLDRIDTMTMDLQTQAGQAEDITNLRAELEDVRSQLQNSVENFADLEKLHGDVVREFTTAKEVFERQLTETDEQIRMLDADHQRSLLAMEAKYRRDTDVLTSNLEDREHGMDELRQELQDLSEAHARAEGELREELKSYEAQHALADDNLRRTITDMHQQLTQADVETLALQEERQLLQTEITGLQAEVQRSTSLTRYLESQIRESEDGCMVLKERLQQLESSMTESEKACKAAEFNLTLQTTQHEKVVSALRREIASLQSGPELHTALADSEGKNREMDDLLRAKCQEIEEYDDRILETLKANKKLMSKVESLTRKVQALQAKLSSMKNQPQELVAAAIPLKKAFSSSSPPTPAGGYPSSAPSLTLRSKTPEPQTESWPQSTTAPLAVPPSHTPGRTSEPSGCEMSAGKKRPAPDDDERDSVPAEGHYSTDACLRNGPTPRLRRAHGHPGGFTPVRGASSRKPVGSSSPGRRLNVGITPSEIITDVTNSPRGSSRQGEQLAKKKSWLGKIRGGAGSQPVSSRLGTFGGQ